MKKFKKIFKNQKGLTLIELLAVIVILAIVAAIAVPAIGNLVNNSKDKALLADASNILAGAKIAMVDGACAGPTATPTPNVCEETELTKYVDGITTGTYSAEKDANGAWSVKYSELGKINDKTKYSGVAVTTAVTEKDLNAALKK